MPQKGLRLLLRGEMHSGIFPAYTARQDAEAGSLLEAPPLTIACRHCLHRQDFRSQKPVADLLEAFPSGSELRISPWEPHPNKRLTTLLSIRWHSNYSHRIPIAVETVTVCNRMPIGRHYLLIPGQGADQKKQRRPG